jgi:GNAT superfamily N-acetyltransferase
MARIAAATTPQELDLARELWREWEKIIEDPAWKRVFRADLEDLEKIYGPPGGAFMLAWEGKELAGGGALRRIDDELCEMQRVYVRPQFRGRGLAQSLSVALMGEARRMGYGAVRFAIPADFVEKLAGGIKLYEKIGFRSIPTYGNNPPDAVCMEARVRSAARRETTVREPR